MSDPLSQIAGAAQTPHQTGPQSGGSQNRLSDEQAQSVRRILSEFDPSDLSAEDRGAIRDALRTEGFRPNGALRDVLVAEGFDPAALAAADDPQARTIGGPTAIPTRAEIALPQQPTAPPETIQTFLTALSDVLSQFDDPSSKASDAQRSVASALLAQGFQIRGNVNQLA